MEENKDTFDMLDLMIRPGFCVEEKKIVRVNQAAQALLITPGMDVRELLLTGEEEYEAFCGGCLYLKLNLTGEGCGASVSRAGGYDVFILDQQASDDQLQAFALAAMELRQPLLNAMLSAERIHAIDVQTRDAMARLNRGLHQLHRIVNNMSDASRFAISSHQQTLNGSKVFEEIFEKARALVEYTNMTLTYQGTNEEILMQADREQLERAVLNMLSNAIKFTPKDGVIHAVLSRKGSLLQLRIQDSGSGIGDGILGNVFSRYLRQPAIEDSRHGIGLGMVLIRSAAAAHGGTVLIDQPTNCGTRVTMTMKIRQGSGSTLRTPIDLPGGQDLGLIELADCLPASLYEK